MFQAHKLSSNNLSVKNLVLLFFTIVLGFASVVTLASVTIDSDINNARQTIGRFTITADGTDAGIRYFDVNYSGDGKTYINPNAMDEQTTFSGKVLGIDNNDDLIYVYGKNLILSSISGLLTSTTYSGLVLGIDENGDLVYINTQSIIASGGGDDGDWTITGNNIYRYTGNVGIGTSTPTNKLHIVNSGSTDVYIEEQLSGMAANLNLKNPVRTWAVGGDSNPDVFYIGEAGGAFDFAITPAGNVGIGTTTPTSKLQIESYAQIGQNRSCSATTDTSGGNFLRLASSEMAFSICFPGEEEKTSPNIQLDYGNNRRQIDNDNQLKFKYATGANYTTKVSINSAGLLGAVDVQISNLINKAVIGTNNAGKIIEATSGSIYNLISGFDLGGGMDDGSTAGVTPYRNGSTWIVNSTNIFNNGGNVGIGTSTPTQKLEVNGNIKLTTGGVISAAAATSKQLYLASNGNVGIGKIPSSSYQLDVSTNIQAAGYYYSSDKRLKTNITPIKNALDKILALNGYFFTWKKTNKKDIGVIAQEVETIFPELVQTNDQGYKSVEYGNLVAPLIEAIKELNDKVDMQEEKIRKLENRRLED